MSVKAFIDTNVFLDWLLEDRPEKPMAKLLFAAASAGYFEACISTQSIIDAAYSAHKNGICFIDFKPKLQSLRSFIKILAIDELDLCWAMEHHTGDFEDDAQWASAYNNVCDYFITRDQKILSFNTSHCPMQAISPTAFVTAMQE